VEEQAPFCPSCGAPQIRVSSRDTQLSETQSTGPSPPTKSVQPPMLLLRVGHPDQLQWKTFLRIAIPLAGVVAFFTAANLLLGLLMLLPGSVILAIHLYRRRQLGPFRTRQGAKLGALIGLLSFACLAIVLAVLVTRDPATYRQETEKAVMEALARNPSPQAQQLVEKWFTGSAGTVRLTALGMTFLLVLLLIIGSLSGALAVALVRDRSGP
jgi:hypothetical protein